MPNTIECTNPECSELNVAKDVPDAIADSLREGEVVQCGVCGEPIDITPLLTEVTE